MFANSIFDNSWFDSYGKIPFCPWLVIGNFGRPGSGRGVSVNTVNAPSKPAATVASRRRVHARYEDILVKEYVVRGGRRCGIGLVVVVDPRMFRNGRGVYDRHKRERGVRCGIATA
jgi:hypothetical protein